MKTITLYLRHQNRLENSRSQNKPRGGPKTARETFDQYIDLRPLVALWDMLWKMYDLSLKRKDGFDARLRKYRVQASQRLEAAKIHNLKTRLKWEMLRDPQRRKQVLDELGGAAAMEAWDTRMAQIARKFHEPMTLKTYKRPDLEALRAGFVEPANRPGAVPTDSTGHFRLAPLPRPLENKWIVAVTEMQRQERAEARLTFQPLGQATTGGEIWSAPHCDRGVYLR